MDEDHIFAYRENDSHDVASDFLADLDFSALDSVKPTCIETPPNALALPQDPTNTNISLLDELDEWLKFDGKPLQQVDDTSSFDTCVSSIGLDNDVSICPSAGVFDSEEGLGESIPGSVSTFENYQISYADDTTGQYVPLTIEALPPQTPSQESTYSEYIGEFHQTPGSTEDVKKKNKRVRGSRSNPVKKPKLYDCERFEDPKQEKRRQDAIKARNQRLKEANKRQEEAGRISTLECRIKEQEEIIAQKDATIAKYEQETLWLRNKLTQRTSVLKKCQHEISLCNLD